METNKDIILRKGKYTGELPPTYYQFKFPPDEFQLWGFNAIENDRNILVTAHTGAGKTALALYAIGKHLQDSEAQVIYTSPIKTLSNQKFKEFGEDFSNIGILTGDVKINPSGNLLIMTAEILRNSLLRKSNKKVYDWNFDPDKVKCVILDEVHFINNKERGKVWEEIITNLNPKIQLVMLSATISGAEDMVNWISKIKGKPCELIPTPFRPTPLHHYIFYEDKLHLVKDNIKWNESNWSMTYNEIMKAYKKKTANGSIKTLFDCITYCQDRNLLPINIFLLNREFAEKIAKKIPFNLISSEESSQVVKLWNKYLLKYRDIYQHTDQWNFILSLAQKGVGVHHSGLIPILKEIVEILYENKLIKVLIATETFAMGVNMPTKTVIFTQTTKFDGNSVRPLRPEEYNQMAGRAGRRGLDDFGTVIILPDEKMPVESEAKEMITSAPQKINSKLDIDYSFILKRMSLKIENNDKNTTIKYVSKSVSESMLANEMKKNNIMIKNELSSLDLDKYEHLKDNLQKYLEYKDINYKLNSGNTSLIKLSNKLIKKYTNRKKQIEKEIEDNLSELELYYQDYNKYNELKKELDNIENNFEDQVSLILNYLTKLKITEFINNDYQLTPLGRIISEINECNPLILGHIFSNQYLDQLEFNEIAAFLSIFIADRSVEEPYISDLNISDEFRDMLSDIGETVEVFLDDETKLNNTLPFNFWSEWTLHLSMFNAVLEWANGNCRWFEIKHLYNTFEGNFCRNILRLVNMIRNIESIALITNNTSLLNKLENYEEKLIRDVVIIDSLYI